MARKTKIKIPGLECLDRQHQKRAERKRSPRHRHRPQDRLVLIGQANLKPTGSSSVEHTGVGATKKSSFGDFPRTQQGAHHHGHSHSSCQQDAVTLPTPSPTKWSTHYVALDLLPGRLNKLEERFRTPTSLPKTGTTNTSKHSSAADLGTDHWQGCPPVKDQELSGEVSA